MKRKIIKSDIGVVGIVVAVLLIGLMVAVISLIQAVYVPKWMEEKEAEHMDQVVTQFAQLKSAIDTQVANENKSAPIATPITLGSKELPYLMSLRAYGNLEILSNSFFKIKIDHFVDVPSNQITELYSFGSIKYSSMNGYFIDQSFIYENGALITSQREGDMISMKPSLSIEKNYSTQDVEITFNMVNINPIGGKINGGGYGTTSILTEYNNTIYKSPIYNVLNLSITTSYQNAWELFINWTLNKVYTYGSDFIITTNNNEVIINFISNKPSIKSKIVNINAQIGPGWVE